MTLFQRLREKFRHHTPSNSPSISTDHGKNKATSLSKKTSITESSFLQLPTEIRQKILFYTVTDEEILSNIDLRGYETDNECVVKWWFWGYNNTTLDGTVFLNHIFLFSVRNLASVHPILTKDLDWVKRRWIARIGELGMIKQNAWESLFGERFQLYLVTIYVGKEAVSTNVVHASVKPIESWSSRYPYSFVQPGGIPPAFFDLEVEELISENVMRSEQICDDGHTLHHITGYIELDNFDWEVASG